MIEKLKKSLADANSSGKEMVEKMKTRLKETLDEKKEFEMEYLQLQKNYLKTKNQLKAVQ